MSAYQFYLELQKQASNLTFAQGLWKGTAAGAIPGAAIGAYKGHQDNPDSPVAGALTGGVIGGFIGGVAGRGAQYASRIHRVAKELGKHEDFQQGAAALTEGMAPGWKKTLVEKSMPYLGASGIEHEVAGAAGKGGFSQAAKDWVHTGDLQEKAQAVAAKALAAAPTGAKLPAPNYRQDAKAFGASVGGAALTGGAAEAAFGDKDKSFGERFREGAMHGAIGGALVSGGNLGTKHLARHYADRNEVARQASHIYNNPLYMQHEGKPTVSFIAGGKKGLAVGLGMDTITGFGTPDKPRDKQAADQFLHLMAKRANVISSAMNAARLPVPNPLKAIKPIKPVTAPAMSMALPKPPALPKMDAVTPRQ